jgi:hypothetical protein
MHRLIPTSSILLGLFALPKSAICGCRYLRLCRVPGIGKDFHGEPIILYTHELLIYARATSLRTIEHIAGRSRSMSTASRRRSWTRWRLRRMRRLGPSEARTRSVVITFTALGILAVNSPRGLAREEQIRHGHASISPPSVCIASPSARLCWQNLGVHCRKSVLRRHGSPQRRLISLSAFFLLENTGTYI